MNIRDKRLKNMLTPGAVAKLLGVSRQRIDQLLVNKRIKYTWIGASRYIAKEDAVKPEPIPPGRPPKRRTP